MSDIYKDHGHPPGWENEFDPRCQACAQTENVWLIEKLWQASLENELSAATGYSPEGYCCSEAEAEALVAEAGICPANGWPLLRDTALRRKVRLGKLTPNK